MTFTNVTFNPLMSVSLSFYFILQSKLMVGLLESYCLSGYGDYNVHVNNIRHFWTLMSIRTTRLFWIIRRYNVGTSKSKSKAHRVLLGLGWSSTSVCLKIFSVQFLVQSARAIRFSKWASSSVFSAWPSFSSVYWITYATMYRYICKYTVLRLSEMYLNYKKAK